MYCVYNNNNKKKNNNNYSLQGYLFGPHRVGLMSLQLTVFLTFVLHPGIFTSAGEKGKNNNNNNNNNNKTMFMVLLSWHSRCKSSSGSFDKPQAKPTDLGL